MGGANVMWKGGVSSLTADSTGVVYLVRSGKFIKIGTSANPQNRMRQLSTGAAIRPELVATMPGGRLHEVALHKEFARYRANGEWFLLPDDVEAALIVRFLSHPDPGCFAM